MSLGSGSLERVCWKRSAQSARLWPPCPALPIQLIHRRLHGAHADPCSASAWQYCMQIDARGGIQGGRMMGGSLHGDPTTPKISSLMTETVDELMHSSRHTADRPIGERKIRLRSQALGRGSCPTLCVEQQKRAGVAKGVLHRYVLCLVFAGDLRSDGCIVLPGVTYPHP